MIHTGEQSPRSIDADRSKHALCALTGALGLIAGKPVSIPKLAFSGRSPSKLARLLQLGNGAWELLLSSGRQSTLVSGEGLAYREGELEYYAGHIFKRWWNLPSSKQPFFVVTNADPAGSVAAFTGCDPQPAPHLRLANHHCVFLIMANWHGTPAVIHYASCDSAIAELERQVAGHEIAASVPQVAHLAPRVLAHNTLVNGATILSRTQLPGHPHEFSWRRIDVATEMWLSRKPASEYSERAWVGQRLAQLCELLPQHRDMFFPAINALLKWCGSSKVPGAITHGDFWLGNVLFQGDAISGIIDWEWAQKDGFLEVDALYMLLGSVVSRNASFANLLRQLWSDEIIDALLSERIIRLTAKSGMDKDDLKFIALMLWFNYIWYRAIEGSMLSKAWSEDLIPRTVPTIMKWLGRHA